jgi:hypothetical protein
VFITPRALLCSALVACALPTLARAQPEPDAASERATVASAPAFGENGEVVITAGTGLFASTTAFSGSDAVLRSAGLNASLDLFADFGFSIGWDFELNYGLRRGYLADGSLVQTETGLISGGPRVGYNLPLGALFSFYPKLTVGLHWATQDRSFVSGPPVSITASATGAPDVSRTGPWIQASLPLLLHAAPHFFLGFGPYLYHDFARLPDATHLGGERTMVGASLEVGGY